MATISKPRWTKEETELVNDMNLSLEDLVKLLPNRSYTNIASKRSKSGLTHKRRGWTDEELELLKNHYQTIISIIHHHPYASILSKGSELGVTKNRP
jgi:hypothetical protein